MRVFVLTLLFFCLSLTTIAQKTTIQVFDKQTEQPIPFVKVKDSEGLTFVADIDGKIDIEIISKNHYTFRFFDYKDSIVQGKDLTLDARVFLTSEAKIFDEVVVFPTENPAHRIIRNVIENKKKNNPLRNNSFSYDSYSKFYMTGQLKEGIIRDTITDSSTIKNLETLDKQYLFLAETRASRTFNPPNYDKEIIHSYNVSGIKEPYLATMVNQFQSFSFYDNEFKLGGTDYISPLSPNSTRRYFFLIEDTLVHSGTSDTTFTISYRPSLGKTFDGLKGYLYINTKDWAVERVIASPYKSDNKPSLLSVRIIQEYDYTNNLKWFPKKISTEIDFPQDLFSIDGDNNIPLIARSSLYIENVEFDISSKRGFNPVTVEVADGALEDSLSLKAARGETYTGKEENTYQMLDSIAQSSDLNRFVEMFKIMTTGVIPIWKLGLPIDRILSYNFQEGYRLGLGLETNRKMSKRFKVGGYFAYGTKDKKWKWGGDLGINIYRKNQIKLQLTYLEDVFQRGGTDFFNKSFVFSDETELRNFFRSKMDRERTAQINLSGLITQNLKVQLFGNYKRYWFIDDYRYIPNAIGKDAQELFDIAEVGLVVSWNIRERVMMLEDQRISLGTKWPKITFKAAKGISGVFNSIHDYYRLNLEISQNFSIRGAGKIDLVGMAGTTIGDVPLTLKQVQEGTGLQFGFFVPNTFQTMTPGEFFSDRSSSLFFYFTFLPIKNKTKWTEPVFVLYSAAGVGTMDNFAEHRDFEFKIPEKGYYESGLKLDNLIKIRFMGIGISGFYRYGPYQFDDWKDNLFGKLTVKIGFQ